MFIRVKDAICQRKEKKTRETNDKNVIIVFLLIVWAQTSNWRLFNMHICFKIYLLLLYKVCQLGFFSLQLFSCTFYQAFLVLLILASNGLTDCPNCCWVFFRHFFLRPRKIYQYFSRYLVKAVHMEQSSIICSNGLKSRFRSLSQLILTLMISRDIAGFCLAW